MAAHHHRHSYHWIRLWTRVTNPGSSFCSAVYIFSSPGFIRLVVVEGLCSEKTISKKLMNQ